jgi:hypothetical protein
LSWGQSLVGGGNVSLGYVRLVGRDWVGAASFFSTNLILLQNTGCPTQRLTTSDQILKIEKSHMPKSKPCFKNP